MNDIIINKLMQEHRQVEGLLDQIAATTEPMQKSVLFLDLKQALIPHLEGEEETFYFRLQDQQLRERALEEHLKIKDYLHKLDAPEIESEEWDELFQELQLSIRLHVAEEESELFSQARQEFTRDEMIQIADDFDHAKSNSHPL
jgi:hypothetical protein